MNFFKSVFTEENPQQQEQHNESISTSQSIQHEPKWGFVNGFIKTIATKSESVFETYRRDLEEFSTGLKSESQVLKEVASSSLELGASKAQESLQSVGNTFDTLGSVVGQIINQNGKNLIDGSDLDFSGSGSGSGSPLGKYSRFESQLRGIRNDMSTFVEEVENLGEYEKWRGDFDLEGKREEIEGLIRGDGNLGGIYKWVVPNLVDDDVFWLRYYFRVYKLEQAESVRAKLVERANLDEDLSWDFDDDHDHDHDDYDDDDHDGKDDVEEVKKVVIDENELSQDKGVEIVKKDDEKKTVLSDEKAVLSDEKAVVGDEKVVLSDEMAVLSGEKTALGDEKRVSREKAVSSNEEEVCEVSKNSDKSIVSSQPSSRGKEEEEDLGWDEIEDLGSEDEDGKKEKEYEGTINKEELRKRLSIVEEDEDLSWDIEDDDEPIKKS